MDGCAAMAAPGCEGLIFLPYLTGERTPHSDPNARGVFFGLSQRHGISEICRLVMEGVVFSLRDTVEILRSHGVPVTSVQAAGGGAASPLWRQMQADMFGAQVLTTDVQEAPAMGAAILAAVGCSAYNTVAEASSDMVRIVSTTDPDPRTAQLSIMRLTALCTLRYVDFTRPNQKRRSGGWHERLCLHPVHRVGGYAAHSP